MEDYKSSNTAYLSDFVYKTRKILNRKGPKLYTVYNFIMSEDRRETSFSPCRLTAKIFSLKSVRIEPRDCFSCRPQDRDNKFDPAWAQNPIFSKQFNGSAQTSLLGNIRLIKIGKPNKL